jgi:hypothetical protein
VRGWIRPLTTVGSVLGAVVIVYGLYMYLRAALLPGLLVAAAIVIVGPGEDLLQAWARRSAPTPEEGEARATVVDRVTSIAFLVLLAFVVYAASRVQA